MVLGRYSLLVSILMIAATASAEKSWQVCDGPFKGSWVNEGTRGVDGAPARPDSGDFAACPGAPVKDDAKDPRMTPQEILTQFATRACLAHGQKLDAKTAAEISQCFFDEASTPLTEYKDIEVDGFRQIGSGRSNHCTRDKKVECSDEFADFGEAAPYAVVANRRNSYYLEGTGTDAVTVVVQPGTHTDISITGHSEAYFFYDDAFCRQLDHFDGCHSLSDVVAYSVDDHERDSILTEFAKAACRPLGALGWVGIRSVSDALVKKSLECFQSEVGTENSLAKRCTEDVGLVCSANFAELAQSHNPSAHWPVLSHIKILASGNTKVWGDAAFILRPGAFANVKAEGPPLYYIPNGDIHCAGKSCKPITE